MLVWVFHVGPLPVQGLPRVLEISGKGVNGLWSFLWSPDGMSVVCTFWLSSSLGVGLTANVGTVGRRIKENVSNAWALRCFIWIIWLFIKTPGSRDGHLTHARCSNAPSLEFSLEWNSGFTVTYPVAASRSDQSSILNIFEPHFYTFLVILGVTLHSSGKFPFSLG